jgi:hypothetical protein
MGDFYLTLLSNASMDIYPDNKTSCFNVHLPKTITLNGHWCLAITEIHYQHNILNVTEGNNTVHSLVRAKNFEQKIPCGHYEKIEDVITKMNQYWSDALPVDGLLEIDSSTKSLKYSADGLKYILRLKFENRLAMQLGFEPNKDISPRLLELALPGDVSRGTPDEMLIYCNIVEPQIVGDELARVIRIVNIPKKGVIFGQPQHHEFQRLQYIDVSKKQFDTISIELRDKSGVFMAFESGTVTLVLHLKKFD